MEKVRSLLPLLLLLTGCATPLQLLYSPAPQQLIKIVYIVNHGKHTGIVVNRREVQESLWPELVDFPNTTYLEVGWGAADYYPATQPTISMGLQALLFPSASVLHVVPLPKSFVVSFPPGRVVAISLSVEGFARLCEFIHNSYTHDAQGRALPVGNSVYGQGYFYQAQGQYHLLNNCNHWTASALRVAGYPITPVYAITANNVMSQLVQ